MRQVGAQKSAAELTVRAAVTGVVLGIVFGAANAYLGLRVGLTVSASIPAAVMTVALFRLLGSRASILESNLSQTIGSASTALATGTVAVLELASFVSGFSSVAEFDVTRVGAVHMEDTSPSNITGGTPSPATPVKSLFQIDAMALRTNLWGAWGLRAPGHAQFITGATW